MSCVVVVAGGLVALFVDINVSDGLVIVACAAFIVIVVVLVGVDRGE